MGPRGVELAGLAGVEAAAQIGAVEGGEPVVEGVLGVLGPVDV